MNNRLKMMDGGSVTLKDTNGGTSMYGMGGRVKMNFSNYANGGVEPEPKKMTGESAVVTADKVDFKPSYEMDWTSEDAVNEAVNMALGRLPNNASPAEKAHLTDLIKSGSFGRATTYIERLGGKSVGIEDLGYNTLYKQTGNVYLSDGKGGRRPASEEELATMKRLQSEGKADGAFSESTFMAGPIAKSLMAGQ